MSCKETGDFVDSAGRSRYNMGGMSISENVQTYLEKVRAGNGLGEKVTLVAATKTRTPAEINEAIEAGITDIGENKVQEFRDKYDLVHGANRHFIGHLQINKVQISHRKDLSHSFARPATNLPTSWQSGASARDRDGRPDRSEHRERTLQERLFPFRGICGL